MNEEYKELLLFNKEIASRGFKYRLYFVLLPSLKYGPPRIKRLICPRAKPFHRAALGKVYDVPCKKNFAKTFFETGEEFLNEGDYMYLIAEKNRLFQSVETVSPFRSIHPAVSGGRYFTFEEIKQVAAFRAVKPVSLFFRVIYALLRAVSLLVPFVTFAWSVYTIAGIRRSSLLEYVNRFWLLPFYFFTSVPFMICLMTLFYTLTETFLLRFNCFKWMILKQHAYATGGIKKGVFLHRKQKTHLLKYGLITGGIYFTGLALVLLF